MKSACKDACDLASWPARERIRALKRIIPRRKVEGVLRDCGLADRGCRRLPGWFVVWFVVALGLFCRDSYRQVFRWLAPYRRWGTPGRSTLCEARRRLGVGDMLLLWDRNFLSDETVQQVKTQQAQLLARIKKNLVFQPIKQLADGSYLAKLYRSAKDRRHDTDGILVRIIEYTLDAPQRPGSGEKHRLLTTLWDENEHPAETLIVPYHERWEEELAIDEIKTHQRERPVLRSETPRGVVQEIYGLLLAHDLVRSLMQQAAAGQQIDPDRLSFTNTLKILRCRLPECPRSQRGRRRWYRDLIDEISEEIIEPRRNRINPRVIKKKMSRWKKKQPEHRRYPQPHKEFREAVVMLN